MKRPNYDYEAAEKRAKACGHSCGCDDLCSYGESKAERAKDERGNTNAAYAGFVLMFAPQVWALMSGQVRWSALGMVLALGVVAVGGMRVVRGVRR